MGYLIIDLEATCWENDCKKGENEIIEFGAIFLDDNYDSLGQFQSFVKPVKNPILSKFCKNLTSIKQKEVDKAVFFPLAFNNLIKWAEETANHEIKYLSFCSWGYYDKNQLIKDCQIHNIEYPFSNHRSLKHEFAKKRGIKPVGMKKALQICDIELTGSHHRALDDAKNIAKIFITEL